LLILRRRYTIDAWYTACMLCQLAAPGLDWNLKCVLELRSFVAIKFPEDGILVQKRVAVGT
jgi:hypothetical protein